MSETMKEVRRWWPTALFGILSLIIGCLAVMFYKQAALVENQGQVIEKQEEVLQVQDEYLKELKATLAYQNEMLESRDSTIEAQSAIIAAVDFSERLGAEGEETQEKLMMELLRHCGGGKVLAQSPGPLARPQAGKGDLLVPSVLHP